MRRRELLVGLVSLLAASTAQAQQPGGPYQVGIMNGGAPAPETLLFVDAIRERLRELGWIEGGNVAYVLEWAEGDFGRFPQMASNLVRARVDVIVAPSTDAALAAKAATATIPIVMVFPVNPIPLGLVASYARPGSNVTGLTTEAGSTIIAKYLDLLVQTIPGLSRVAVLLNATSFQQQRSLGEMQEAAVAFKIDVRGHAVRDVEDFAPAFARMAEERCGALIVLADSMFYQHRARLAALALKHRLPAMSSVRDFVESGGLMRYIADLIGLYRGAAGYVDRILKGANPAELPVEQPSRFDLVINLQTARTLGLRIPQPVLLRADKLIE